MSEIDQTSIIEQLAAENAALRDVFRHSPDREIQIIAAVSAVLDELTRIGPKTTARVLLWAFERYGIQPASFVGAWSVRDRRPKEFVPAPMPEPLPAPEPATTETTRLKESLYKGIFVIRNTQGDYWSRGGFWTEKRSDAKVYKASAWAERAARFCEGSVEREEPAE